MTKPKPFPEGFDFSTARAFSNLPDGEYENETIQASIAQSGRRIDISYRHAVGRRVLDSLYAREIRRPKVGVITETADIASLRARLPR